MSGAAAYVAGRFTVHVHSADTRVDNAIVSMMLVASGLFAGAVCLITGYRAPVELWRLLS